MGLSSAMKQRNDALGAGAGGAPAGGYASPTGPPPGAQGGFASPTGPPPNFASPGGPPPGHYQAGAFASPTGPPPNFMSPTGPPPGHQAGSTEPSVAQITAILKHTVADGIQAFYPATQQGRLEGIANQIIQTRAVSLLAARWRISTEKAIEFTKLALFDIVLFLDDSGSMRGYEDGARIDDLKVYVAFVASLFDDDGIEVRFLNSSSIGNGIKNDGDVQKLVEANPFKGVTNLGKEMWAKVLDPLIVRPAQKGTLQKPVLVISITDGEPYPEPAGKIRAVIKDTKKALKKTRYGEDALSLQFAQVGNDQAAQDFLAKLDDDSSIGGLVDVTSNYEWEQAEIKRKTGKDLTPEDWLMKLLLGAVDTKFDAQDGGPKQNVGSKFKKFFS